jgi:multidrug transporter EmrE-like cation transporter
VAAPARAPSAALVGQGRLGAARGCLRDGLPGHLLLRHQGQRCRGRHGALGSSPLFAGLFDRWRGRRPSGRWAAATALAIAGIVLLSGAAGRTESLHPLGLAAALAAGAAYAGYAVAAGQLVQQGVAALPATAAVIGTSGLIGAAILPFTDNGWVAEPGGLALAGWLGGVTVVVSYLLVGSALRHLPASTAITLGLAEPLTAALLGVFVLHETLGPFQIVGVVAVLAGVVVTGTSRTSLGVEPADPHQRSPMATFQTTLFSSGTNVGIEVPPEVVESFGAGKRVPVRVTIAGYSYASTIAVMGGRYLIPLAAAHRSAAGVAGGETHEVTLVLDTSARDTPVPEDLAEALAAAGRRGAFDALAPSRRKEHVRAVTEAKASATRQRRISRVVEALS